MRLLTLISPRWYKVGLDTPLVTGHYGIPVQPSSEMFMTIFAAPELFKKHKQSFKVHILIFRQPNIIQI